MRAIFISYRRDDTEGHAGRLFEDLCERFGKDAVFMDVAGIEPGRDFRRAIEQQVASCGVLLAVIGKDWLNVTDAQGRRRLDDPYDFVRLETAGALKRDIPVIPVLVHQAEMPRPEQLPDELKDLAFRNGVELTHARWASDVQVLIAALLPYVDAAPPRAPAPVASAAPDAAPSRRHPGWVTGSLAALAAGGIGYFVWDHLPSTGEGPSAAVPGASNVALAPAPAPLPSSAAHAGAPAPPPVERPASASVSLAPASAPQVVSAKPAGSAATKPRRVDAAVSPRPTAAAPPPALESARAAPSSVPMRTVETASPAAAPPPAIAPAIAAAPPPAPVLVESPAPSPPVDNSAAPREAGLDLLGSPGAASMVTRTIAIKPDTKYVNVTGGEVIRFEVGTRSFVWNFSGQRSSFDLARVAPPSFLDHKVTAYVAPNPMYPRRH